MKKALFFLFCCLLMAAPAARAVQFSYQTLDYPTASAASGGTMAQGVSGSNIVGTYFDASSQSHGFLYNGSAYSSLDDPASIVTNSPGSFVYLGTFASGISGGDIVGYYVDTNAQTHGFLYDGSAYSPLDEPASIVTNSPGSFVYLGTFASGISGGSVVGYYVDNVNGMTHGFLYDGGNYTSLDDPNALASSFDATYAYGVDGGNIVGVYGDPENHGFLYEGGAYTTLDYNTNTVGFTEAYGISGGDIVGYYQDAGGNIHSFLYNAGVYSSFDYPGSSHTYATGISSNTIVGYYIDTNNITHGFIATMASTGALTNTGSLQVTITPSGAIADGAQWQVDGGMFQSSGTTATNLSIGNHTLSFSTISGWSTPASQTVAISTNSTTPATGTYILQQTGSLKVTLGPPGAVSAGVRWEVDGSALQTNGAIVSNLVVGRHTVVFEPVPGWTPPPDQFVTITNGATTSAAGLYMASVVPADGLVLVTNGPGTIQPGTWPKILVGGHNYAVKALPNAGSLFMNWVGGTNLPYAALSTSASYTFTMQSGLLLEANFVTNPFLAAHGAYLGLFAPGNTGRGQSNSGSFNFLLTTGGGFSGDLHLGSQTVPLTGKFGSDGSAVVTSKRHNQGSLTTSLQLDFAHQAVSGAVSNDDGSFLAQLTGYQNVFSARNPATNYAGRYTVIIPGATNAATGPYGTSYGTVLVKPSGTVSFAGSLADGTPVSQSSVVSEGGSWPFYLPLYGGKGSLWSWNYFTNGAITSPSYASWINATNASRTASYRSGFTNQAATVSGGLYLPADQPFLVLTIGEMIFAGGGLPFAISNQVTLASSDPITFTSVTNDVTLTVNQTTGVISGSFLNPSDGTKPVKLGGVLESGQGNGAGYFPGTNQSGSFNLDVP